MPERVHHRFAQDEQHPKKKTKLLHESISQLENVDTRVGVHSVESDQKRKKSQNANSILPKNAFPSDRGNGEARNGTQGGSNGRSNIQTPTIAQDRLNEKARALLSLRQKLPIWPKSDAIRQSLRTRNILLLVGETGSGKSTQVPQFLTTEPWCQRRMVRTKSDQGLNGASKEISVGGCIAITEPRRVAAITLARRVAEEMGSSLGSTSRASTVGYSVRFDNSTSPSTKIKFLTDGMLLQEMLRDPWLREYSAVIVDEVHERGVNVDLLMGFLSKMVAGRNEGRAGVPLKVVVMSATADMVGLLKFFERGYRDDVTDSVDAKNVLSEGHTEEDEEGSIWSGFSHSDDGDKENAGREKHDIRTQKVHPPNSENNHDLRDTARGLLTNVTALQSYEGEQSTPSSTEHVSICHVEGRQYPVSIIYTPKAVPDIIEASLRTVFEINYQEPLPGDILVFLPGQSTVENLCGLVQSHANKLAPSLPKLLPLPLFAALPQHSQQLVFRPAPPRTRKVIIATNIAETSLTVPGVRHVVDSGKSKVKQYRPRLGLDSLLVKPISQSAATQRAGRAGREGPGSCYRLYTAEDFATLAPVPEPEILRADLAQAILALKAQGVSTREIPTFPFLSPPPREALEAALLHLHRLGALDDTGEITRDIGLRIARLPVSAALGRALLAAASPELDCLDEMIDLAACLSGEAIFLNLNDNEDQDQDQEEGKNENGKGESQREKADASRRTLFRREGDHLTMLAALRGFLAETVDRKAWAERHFVSHRAMRGVLDIRKQLRALMMPMPMPMPKPTTLATVASSSSASPTNPVAKTDTNSKASGSSANSFLLRALLRGFPLNAVLLSPDGSYRTVAGRHPVAIHPSSVLYSRGSGGSGSSKPAALVYSEFVYTTRAYARGVSVVEREWVLEALGA